MHSDGSRRFWVITQESDFSQACSFCRKLDDHIFIFSRKILHKNRLVSCHHFWSIFKTVWTLLNHMDFFTKIGLPHFSYFKILLLYALNQKKLTSHFSDLACWKEEKKDEWTGSTYTDELERKKKNNRTFNKGV